MLAHVTIYTSKNCPYSKRLKDFLYEKGIPFEEIRADESKENADKLSQLDNELRTPIIQLTSKDKIEILLGWNEDNKRKIFDLIVC